MAGVFIDINKRFWEKVDKCGPGGCWTWLGAKDRGGYGGFEVNHKLKRAHRVSYELCVGPIDDNIELMHSCDHPWCVNPEHLKPGTHMENMIDMKNKKRYKSLFGESHPKSKLTESDVISIFQSNKSTYQLGKEFNISASNVWSIKSKRTWSEITNRLIL